MSTVKCPACGKMQIVNKKGNKVNHSEDCPLERQAKELERINAVLHKIMDKAEAGAFQ